MKNNFYFVKKSILKNKLTWNLRVASIYTHSHSTWQRKLRKPFRKIQYNKICIRNLAPLPSGIFPNIFLCYKLIPTVGFLKRTISRSMRWSKNTVCLASNTCSTGIVFCSIDGATVNCLQSPRQSPNAFNFFFFLWKVWHHKKKIWNGRIIFINYNRCTYLYLYEVFLY